MTPPLAHEYVWIGGIFGVTALIGTIMSQRLRNDRMVNWSMPMQVNGIELGMTWEEVMQALGEPQTEHERDFNQPWKFQLSPSGEIVVMFNPKWTVREVRGVELRQSGRVLLCCKKSSRKAIFTVLGDPQRVDDGEEACYYYFSQYIAWGVKLKTSPFYRNRRRNRIFELHWIALTS